MSSEASVRVRVAVCVCREGRVLLVQHEKEGRRYWLLPGGGVEPGETLAEAAAREVEEETGCAVDVGRLLLVCEAIEPRGRHIVNLIFAASLRSDALRLGDDSVLRDVVWQDREALQQLELRPPIAAVLADLWQEDFSGPVRVLGNVWRPAG